METTQSQMEYRESLQKQIEAMPPLERACSIAVVNLGTVVATLINNHHWEAIQGIMDACSELFEQAARIKDEEKQRTLH